MRPVGPSTLGAAALVALVGAGLVAQETAAGAGDPEDPAVAFNEANRLFESSKSEEDLRAAIALWQGLIDRGLRNAHLHYNLGNAWLRLREPGRAIAEFRRALLYDPEHSRALAMLEFARKLIPDTFAEAAQAGPLEILFAWHRSVRLGHRLWGAALCLAAFWGILIARLWRRPPLWRSAATATAIAGLTLLVSSALEIFGARGAPAVVVAAEAQVRSGNGEEYRPVFEKPVQSGVEITVLETRNHWHQAEFPGGTVGWVQAGAVERIAP